MSGEFRQYLFPHDHPRLAEVRGLDPYTYREAARKEGTFTGDLVQGWTPLYLNEFRGITEDGVLRADVHPFALPLPGEEAPVAAMVAAAHDLLAALGDEDRTRVSCPVDAVINGFLGEVVAGRPSSTSSATTSRSTAHPTCAHPGAGSSTVTTARSTASSSRAACC
jgi:hypothetical protein